MPRFVHVQFHVLAFAAVTLLTASLGPAIAQAQVVHPTKENLEDPSNLRWVSRTDTLSGDPSLDALAQRFRRSVRIDSIGSLDGPVEHVIGTIWDVAVNSSDRIFVLDAANRMVRVFSAAGVPLFTIGRAGDGPIEFRGPVGMWISANGNLLVLDAVHGLKIMSLDAQRRTTLVRQLRLKGSARAGCSIGDTVVSLAPTLETLSNDVEDVLVATDLKSGRAWSFGRSYKSETRVVRMVMSEGVVSCDTDGILNSLSDLPYLRRFGPDGTLQWTVRLKDFVIGRWIERPTSRGQPSIGLDPDGLPTSVVRRLVSLGGGIHAVQVATMTKEGLQRGSIYGRIETYLLDQSGRGVFVGSQFPLLAALFKDRLYGFENDPFPRVLMFELPKH